MTCRLLLLLLTSPLFAQDVVQERISVVLRDIRVHVVDRDGNPVTGLTAEDFALREGKTDQELSFFEEVDQRTGAVVKPDTIDLTELGAGGAVVKPAGRAVILFLDTSNIAVEAFEPMIKAAQDLVRAEVRPGVKMKILHYDDKLNHLSPFSEDVGMLADSLLKARYKGHFRQALLQNQRWIIDAMEELDIAEAASAREAAGNTGASLAVNLAVAPQFEENRREELNDFIYEKERLKMAHFQSYYLQMEAMAQMLGPHPDTKAIYHLSGGVYLQPAGGQYLDTRAQSSNLTKLLNRHNVTVYSFVQADRNPIGEVLKVGTHRIEPPRVTSGNSQFEDTFQLQSGPHKVATDTGGFFSRADGTASVAAEVVKLQESSRHYYRLVYTVDPEDAGERIRVKLVNKGRKYKLHYGKVFGRKKAWNEWTRTDKQLAFEASLFFSREKRNELNCRYSFNRFRNKDGKVIIPVAIDLPLARVPKNGYEIGVAAVGQDESLYDVIQATVVKPPRAAGIRMHHVLVSEADPDAVRFFVRNNDTGEFSIHEKTTREPIHTEDSFHLSEVVLSQDDDYRLLPLNMMENAKKADKDRRSVDPMVLGEMLVRGREKVYRGEPLKLFFHINGLSGDPARLSLQIHVMQGKQSGSAQFQQLGMVEVDGGWRVYGQIPDLALKAGEYELRVQAVHMDTLEAHTRIMPLIVSN
ncbi:MAG: VWA domain-containing protein [Acidobacteriota bacterium]|nr:VWA domain-containing protein [Acidobacteriota bacterium]